MSPQYLTHEIFFVTLKIFRYCLGIFAVPLHTQVQAFNSQVEKVCRLRGLDGAKIAHKLCRRLCYVCAAKTETLGVGHAVIAFVGRAKTGEFIGILCPVKPARVNDAAADSGAVVIQIFCGGVCDDVGAPLKRAAVYRSCKGVVDN